MGSVQLHLQCKILCKSELEHDIQILRFMPLASLYAFTPDLLCFFIKTFFTTRNIQMHTILDLTNVSRVYFKAFLQGISSVKMVLFTQGY